MTFGESWGLDKILGEVREAANATPPYNCYRYKFGCDLDPPLNAIRIICCCYKGEKFYYNEATVSIDTLTKVREFADTISTVCRNLIIQCYDYVKNENFRTDGLFYENNI